MQHLRQLLLCHALPLSVFGDESAEKLFIQSDHLALYCTRSAGKSNRPVVEALFDSRKAKRWRKWLLIVIIVL